MTVNKFICSCVTKHTAFFKNFDAYICLSCGSMQFVGVSNSPKSEFKYDSSTKKYSSSNYLHGKQLRWAHDELLKENWSGRRVLEIRCFNGFFLDELKKKGANVYGFDVHQDATQAGLGLFNPKDRFSNSLIEITAQAPFDDILCIDLVEHLIDPTQFISDMRKLLNPDGYLYIAEPILERKFRDKSDYPPHHKSWFSQQGLEVLLANGNYHIAKSDLQYDGYLFFRKFLSKIIHGNGKVEYHGDVVVSASKMEGFLGRNIQNLMTKIRTLLFKLFNIPYYSAIIVGGKY